MSSRKIISFDVGIKNMAYCIFELVPDGQPKWKILDWNSINLLEDINADTSELVCNQCIRKDKGGRSSGDKKSAAAANTPTKYLPELRSYRNPIDASASSTIPHLVLCGNRAKYEKNNQYYCEKHCKKSGFMMPSKSTYPAYLKKKKLGELYKIALLYDIADITLKDKRQDLIQKILNYFENHCLKLIEKKQVNSKKESLITIARNIRDKFDNIETMNGITDVLIENQISSIASRMSTIQGLLTQYFIMRHDQNCDTNIEFISSRNKLKMFENKAATAATVNSERLCPDESEITPNQRYKNHKKDSIIYAKQILDKYPEYQSKWATILETKKKDDLADCFLQGIWYIECSGQISTQRP